MMKIMLRAKKLDITPALRDYVEKRVRKIEKYFDEAAIEAQVSLEVEKERHIVEVTAEVDGILLRAEDETGDMYSSIDGVVDKLERQIRKYKTRLNRKLRQEANVLKEERLKDFDKSEKDDDLPKIVRTKRFAIKPMPVEEAAMQMDLIGHSFFVFQNADTEEVNVVYKRHDGNYGLIEPEF